MPKCFYCGSGAAYWTIFDKQGNKQEYCDDCFKSHNLAPLKKEMDEFHRRPKPTAGATSSPIDEQTIKATIDKVLMHEAPVVWGTVSDDLQQPLSELEKAVDRTVLHIRFAILSRASGRAGGPYWWDGAIQLCKVLSRLGTPSASDALLDLVEQDSRIVEFDRVRAQAALCVGDFKNKSLVPRLVAVSKLPNAPVLAIKKAIETLGGETLQNPEVIIEEGRSMDDPADAVRFFQSHQHLVSTWPKENQGGFYFFFARKVERLHGTEAAKPYYAAGLLANPSPNAVGWQTFGSVPKTRDSAMALAQKHPLPQRGPKL